MRLPLAFALALLIVIFLVLCQCCCHRCCHRRCQLLSTIVATTVVVVDRASVVAIVVAFVWLLQSHLKLRSGFGRAGRLPDLIIDGAILGVPGQGVGCDLVAMGWVCAVFL